MNRICCLVVALITVLLVATSSRAEEGAPKTLKLQTRQRVANPENKDQFKIVYKTVEWDPQKTAVIVCDMWDKHGCTAAAVRVAEMAPRVNQFVAEARRRGALIIHAPSDTMKFYKDHPGRKLVLDAPKIATEKPLKRWCSLDEEREPPLPIDDSDGGCDSSRTPGRPWTQQIKTIEIKPGDAIDDSPAVFNLLAQRGIDNVVILGVHTNMCVLGRAFGIRQMVGQGKNVVLVRDLTDAMYNPAKRPQVSHFRGTELVVEHIEKHWCPTITSCDLLDGPSFVFKADKRPHVAFLVSDDHYHADKTMPPYAQWLRQQYGLRCTVLHGEGKADIPHLDELRTADVLVVFVRRLLLPKGQLAKIRSYIDAGKPVVGLRTASHAFCLRKGDPPAGCGDWPEFDHDVLGGSYTNHGPNDVGSDIAPAPDAADHPLLRDVKPEKWHSNGSLYFTAPIADGSTLVQVGTIPGRSEPVTWTRTYHGGRVVYSSLGHWDDFKEPPFRTLLRNAIYWAMDRPVPEGK